MVTAICFFDDIRKSFKEAFRILKPDGCIIIGFIDKKSKLGKKYAENKSKSKFYKHAIFYSAEDVIKNLKLAGFKIEKIRQTLIPEQSSRTIIDDFGQGAFIVIKALKINPKTAV
jgi:ubiquinone/menaquinone biosynthesis C-methylase UbiE